MTSAPRSARCVVIAPGPRSEDSITRRPASGPFFCVTRASVQDRAGHELLERPRVPPGDLELLRAAEVELDVVLDCEADAAPHLLTHRGDVPPRLAREELGHRREA